MRHDLSPNETSQIVRNRVAYVSVGNDQVEPAVVGQIDEFRGPGPTTQLDGLRLAHVGELRPALFAFILEQRVAAGHAAYSADRRVSLSCGKFWLVGNPVAGRRPHIADI